MPLITQWNTVEKECWTYKKEEMCCDFVAYKLTGLPDFTEPRFAYLSKEVDDRQNEVIKKQFTMLRQFHGLSSKWAISLRLLQENKILTLYLVFRYAGKEQLSEEERKASVQKIRNSLLNNEYTFEEVTDYEKDSAAFTADWSSYAAEIVKAEGEYQGDTLPTGDCSKFYVPQMWTAAENSMEIICSALVNHPGKAVIEITAVPTYYLEDERMWVSTNLEDLKDCMNGQVFRDSKTSKILWQGRKLPILKVPVDNFDKMNKQYEASRMFLTSVRLFVEQQPEPLGNSLLVNSVRDEAKIQVFRKGFSRFDYYLDCYKNLDISADAHTRYWYQHQSTAPYRAQRMNRLCSLEELSDFMRIPIPIRPGFPGFGFDTGISVTSPRAKTDNSIVIGKYMDIAGEDQIKAEFNVQQFAKHGLIVGVPGSGKTTAMFNILYQLWDRPKEERIPFIILEPAKTEYRALKQLDIFQKDMLVFTLGDESVSPFRFNPMEVLPGIRLENHISKLQACFTGAFNLFDPLPIFLEQAIRRTYLEKGWYDDSRGGDPGLETPTLSDLSRNAEYIVEHSGFDPKMKSDFKASLLERLNSLRRGSKGRMLDTRHTIPMDELMEKPVVLELDSLNGDEKSLLMMFLLTYVFEYCKVRRKSGSPLKHMLLVEEAHNLISSQKGGSSDTRADPSGQTIELFVNMLAEMRALGEGILIADQLPTAIAPQAVKQTNVKILMRVTAKDDREEIGNTMDLNEEQMHQVVNFKTGFAYLYHEGEDWVRTVRMVNFKGEHNVEEPPSDKELEEIMASYEDAHSSLYMPYELCTQFCTRCDRRVRNQAESYITETFLKKHTDPIKSVFTSETEESLKAYYTKFKMCDLLAGIAKREKKRLEDRYGTVGESFRGCALIHMLELMPKTAEKCNNMCKNCSCSHEQYLKYLNALHEKE
ncbi:MAG: ATP-binding protein [Solobacterium sp.]|nr:ATP-binding protein [Solobacterium sp.]